jgi:hypothetical protein
VSDFDDREVLEVFEQSVLIGRAECARLAIRRFAAGSRTVSAVHHLQRGVAMQSGRVILIAVAVHVVLMAVLARPSNLYWLILPTIAAVAGFVLARHQQGARHSD